MNARWLVPQTKYTLNSAKQCEDLLQLGYTLINNEGFTVTLGNDGKQMRSNPNRKRAYKFSHAYLWQILDVDSEHYRVINYNKLSFKINNFVIKFCKKYL